MLEHSREEFNEDDLMAMLYMDTSVETSKPEERKAVEDDWLGLVEEDHVAPAPKTPVYAGPSYGCSSSGSCYSNSSGGYAGVAAWNARTMGRVTNYLSTEAMKTLERDGHLMYMSPEMTMHGVSPGGGALGMINMSTKDVYMNFSQLVHQVGVESACGVFRHETYLHGTCGFANDPAIYMLEDAYGSFGL